MVKKFLGELRRRRVLNTASFYVVGAWLALQVADVLSEAGLPPSALRQLLIILSACFPVVLLVGWFYDVSARGVRRTPRLRLDQHPEPLRFIDYGKIAGLFLVILAVAYVLSFPPPIEAPRDAGLDKPRPGLAVLEFASQASGDDEDPIGKVIAEELRRSVAEAAPLRVIGPATSEALYLAGEARIAMAREMNLASLLEGDVTVEGEQITIDARLLVIPSGDEIWSESFSSSMAGSIEIQHQIVDAVMTSLKSTLAPLVVVERGLQRSNCNAVYDVYLRARQLTSRPISSEAHRRGRALLEDAVMTEPDCAIAWEALAKARLRWDIKGFAEAGAAARHALELDASLPYAWLVLAEIAEQQKRWSSAEEAFSKVLKVDPSNSSANAMYAESLMARGRVEDARHYALEAYLSDPASRNANHKVVWAGKMTGDADLVIKHANILTELSADALIDGSLDLAYGYIMQGEIEKAIEIYETNSQLVPDWTFRCVRAQADPALAVGLREEMAATITKMESGQIKGVNAWWAGWLVQECATSLSEADLLIDWFLDNPDIPTEAKYFMFFYPNAVALRQHERFREMVVADGLLDYWRKWGWSDYCRPDGDSFVCD
jgi:tetratricopeptide (TPR) repeat protein